VKILNNFPDFFGTQRFIATFARPLYWPTFPPLSAVRVTTRYFPLPFATESLLTRHVTSQLSIPSENIHTASDYVFFEEIRKERKRQVYGVGHLYQL
jgi:hypothetical protein